MPVRKFNLDPGGTQTISIFQEIGEEGVTIFLNNRILGTLTTPEELRAGREFRLDDGSIVAVKVVNQKVEVRHRGFPLLEAKPHTEAPKPASPRDRVTRLGMLLCASIASAILLISLFLVMGNLYKTTDPTSAICLFRCLPGPIAPTISATQAPCVRFGCPNPIPPTPSPLPTTALPDGVLLAGWVLPTLIAFFIGLSHAVAHHSRRWITLGLLPALVLEIILLVVMLSPLSRMRLSQDETLWLLIPFYVIVFLVSTVCLVYARSMQR